MSSSNAAPAGTYRPAHRANTCQFDAAASIGSATANSGLTKRPSTKHTRTGQTRLVEPHRVILVDGILIFVEKALREMFDVRIFVDTDADIRFIRRLERDIAERGRTEDMVVKQYLATVRPMHLEFVEPSKRHADVILPEGGHNKIGVEMVIARVILELQRRVS